MPHWRDFAAIGDAVAAAAVSGNSRPRRDSGVARVQIDALTVAGAWLVSPHQHGDDRGTFLKWYRFDELDETVGRSLSLAHGQLLGLPARRAAAASPSPMDAEFLRYRAEPSATAGVALTSTTGRPAGSEA
jgi:hypothetical protein